MMINFIKGLGFMTLCGVGAGLLGGAVGSFGGHGYIDAVGAGWGAFLLAGAYLVWKRL
jgi:hypothetical protein